MNDQDVGVAGALVEVFEHERICGWVEVAPGRPPVQVDLYVDDQYVDTAWAVDPAQRHSGVDVRSFEFTLADLWDFVGPANRLTVRTGGRLVPICGHGAFAVPDTGGRDTLSDLSSRLAAGEVFSRTGALQLSRSLDLNWQEAVLALYTALRPEVRAVVGSELGLAYGTLLGAVREGGFIGHDLNFDCAFVSRHRDAAAAARELRHLAFALIDRGFAVRAAPASIQVTHPQRPDVLVNLFHLYVDEAGALQFPYGVAGELPLTATDWDGGDEVPFGGARVLLPAAPKAVLEHIYGPDWHVPNPGFRWARDRRSAAVDAHLPAAAREEIYWADFYARTTYVTGSTFFDVVNARADLPDTVVDIGCGDGRDSFAFANAGRARVTGLDRSHVGVRQATRKAVELGLGDRLVFAACDAGEAEALQAALRNARAGDGPMVFYARFFLHSIPEDVQRTLMSAIAGCARPGDYFAAEFRTDRDEAVRKVHGNHYRRFQNGAAFGRSLRETYGFTPLLEQEGNGFSPYRDEDPQLYRVVARRS